MRSALKALLPVQAINLLREIRDRNRLKSHPALSFDASPLKKKSEISLPEIFTQDYGWTAFKSRLARQVGENLPDSVNPGDCRAIYHLVRALKPQNVLEVGTHIGSSTLIIAGALRENGGGKITSVDILNVNAPNGPWKKLHLAKTPAGNIAAIGCETVTRFVASPAQDFMAQTEERFDFIFLDGDHSAAAVYGEVAHALKILRPGGVILLHDVFPAKKPLYPDGNIIPGPWLGLERLMRENPGLALEPLSELPWPTKQGSSVTSLALLLQKP